eukprot:g1617.t1
MSQRELNRVCKDATEKALHELVHSKRFIEYISHKSISQARTARFYQALVLLLSCLLISSSVYYWYSCVRVSPVKSAQEESTPSVEIQYCNAKLGFPEINWRKMEDAIEQQYLFLWKLVEQYNQKKANKDQYRIFGQWMLPKNWKRRISRTPWDGPFLIMAEAVYDRFRSFVPFRSQTEAVKTENNE